MDLNEKENVLFWDNKILEIYDTAVSRSGMSHESCEKIFTDLINELLTKNAQNKRVILNILLFKYDHLSPSLIRELKR